MPYQEFPRPISQEFDQSNIMGFSFAQEAQKNQIMRKTSAWVYWQICSAGIVLYCRDILAD